MNRPRNLLGRLAASFVCNIAGLVFLLVWEHHPADIPAAIMAALSSLTAIALMVSVLLEVV